MEEDKQIKDLKQWVCPRNSVDRKILFHPPTQWETYDEWAAIPVESWEKLLKENKNGIR